MLIHACFILSLIISLGIVLVLISQLNTVIADQPHFEYSIKIISSDLMSGMSNNMSGMQGMSGMSNNMSGMQGMSGMGGMSRMLGISSNEEITVFLEWMFVLAIVLIGTPFAWVFLRERRKKNSNQTNTA